MKIAVVGAGYVGFSLGVLLSQHHSVTIVDIDENKIKTIKNHRSPIADSELEDFIEQRKLTINASTDGNAAYCEAEFVIIATPTNYDEKKNSFDTSIVDSVIKQINLVNPKTITVIKSTVPIGYTSEACRRHSCDNLLFSPEFLREGQSLHDNLYPSRVIVGLPLKTRRLQQAADAFINLIREGATKKDIETRIINSAEAEAIKLFSNTYLALRISFFNEIDTYAELLGLDTKSIIDGVGLDPRIGIHYNNPSFGYGGYCLTKDTKQLLANYNGVPQKTISAVVEANETRKKFIVDQIIAKRPKVVGVYRLAAKKGSDNYRSSSILDIIKALQTRGIKTVIYEPMLNTESRFNSRIVQDLTNFKSISDIILANRYHEDLADASEKVYTRDIYFRD